MISFDVETKQFLIPAKDSNSSNIYIDCGIKLTGFADDIKVEIDTQKPINDYLVVRFVSPFWNKGSNVHKIKSNNKSIGYIFPSSILNNDEPSGDDDFNLFRQAYRFYCLFNIIEAFAFEDTIVDTHTLNKKLQLDYSYLIISKLQLADLEFPALLPSLALHGFYSAANDVTIFSSSDLGNKFKHNYKCYVELKAYDQIIIKPSKHYKKLMINGYIENLYTQLLKDIHHPLHRFILIYQVCEYLIENDMSTKLKYLVENQANEAEQNKFLLEILDTRNFASKMNILFSKLNFQDRDIHSSTIKNFVNKHSTSKELNSLGETIYSCRNLIFHGLSKFYDIENDDSICQVVSSFEICVHHLILDDSLFSATPLIEN